MQLFSPDVIADKFVTITSNSISVRVQIIGKISSFFGNLTAPLHSRLLLAHIVLYSVRSPP